MTETFVEAHPFTLRDAARRVHDRQVSCVELLDDLLDRTERMQPRLNCYITVLADEARAEAQDLDRRLARGDVAGPLHGIPISIKDNIATAGIRTTAGSKLLTNWRPNSDATVVERLRRAGAIVIAKANLHELAYGAADAGFGDVANPVDTNYSCSGSSSGSASSVGAGLCYASIGTDTGGSIRVPSALCGVVGLKPTYGLVSRAGVVPVSTSLDHIGPITRTVDDAAAVLGTIVGFDPHDPTSADAATVDYLNECARGVAGLRIGILDERDFGDIDPHVAAAILRMYEAIVQEARDVRIVRLTQLAEARTPMWLIARAEAADFHRADLVAVPEKFGPVARKRLTTGMLVSAVDYVRAQRVREQIRHDVANALTDVDALLLPATATVAFRRGESEIAVGECAPKPVSRAMGGYTPIFNLTGQPALVLRCARTDAGLPVAIQVAARPHEDAVAFRVGCLIEKLAAATETSNGV